MLWRLMLTNVVYKYDYHCSGVVYMMLRSAMHINMTLGNVPSMIVFHCLQCQVFTCEFFSIFS